MLIAPRSIDVAFPLRPSVICKRMEVSQIAAFSKQPISGASLDGTTTSQIAASMPTNRNCTVELTNRLVVPLVDPQYYCSSGHCHTPMQPVIGPSTREAFAFSKASEAPRGSVGVFTYRIGKTNFRLAVLFSVPYDYNFSSNWYAIGFVPENTPADDALYQAMYYNEEWASQSDKKREKASSGVTLHIHYENLEVSATMSDAKRSIIKLDVTSSNVIQSREGSGTDEFEVNYGFAPPHPHHHHHHHHGGHAGWSESD
ncbi:unnamed protein product [Allacma fusca]|uniref:Uncharacterized protein n=1 Tax=Allacma fusca TaxID=39272 RepID=A0A8J2KGE5_9HEXA|nr:unnamed protein product [Allacma fusca]